MSTLKAEANQVDGAESRQELKLPADVFRELHAFILDKCTGNVEINIRNGQVLGATVKKHVKL